MANELRTKLRIDAETSGQPDVSAMADAVQRLADEGGGAAPELSALARELRELAAADGAARAFAAIKGEVRDLANAMSAAQSRVDGIGDAMQSAAASTGQAAAAQADAAAKLAASRATLEQLQGAISGASAEMKALRAAAQANGAAAGEYAEKLAATKGQLVVLRTEAAAAKTNIKALAAEHAAAVTATRQAEAAEKALSAEYGRAVREARNISAALGEKNRALDQSREALRAAGVDASNLVDAQRRLGAEMERVSDAAAEASAAAQARAAALREQAQEEDRLAAIVATSRAKMEQAAREQLEAEKAAYAEAEAAARKHADSLREKAEAAKVMSASINRAFSSIGIRSADEIRAEISRINQDLITLGASAKVSGTEFDRAWERGQARLKELQAELDGAARSGDNVANAMGRAGDGIQGLATAVKPLAQALAAAFSVDYVARTAVSFDALNRSLTAIAGDAQGAARELGYITGTASRLGLELESTSKAYTSWLAATESTNLAGEKSRAIFEAIAGTMSRLGRSTDDINGALLALSQMVSKGVVSMEELRGQLGERLPGAMQAVARSVGLTEQQLIKMVESGRVLAEDILPPLAAELERMYASGGEVQGYAAAWNRLTNAVTESVGRITQTEAVMKPTLAVLGALKEVVLIVGTGFVTAAEGVSLFGRILGAVAANINPARWGELREEIARMADESVERINQLARQTVLAKIATDGLGAATADTARQADGAGSQWLAVENAYTQVGAAAAELVTQTEKALAARKAEADAAVAYAQAAGNEAEQRQAAAEAAQAVAAASVQVAAAKQAELVTLHAELAAKQAALAVEREVSAAKRQAVADVERRLQVAREEAAAAAAVAEQERLAAVEAVAHAAAISDNAARVTELRDAYQAAAAEVARMQVLNELGLRTAEDLQNARRGLVAAEILYKDAVADNVRNIEAQARAAQAAANVEQGLVQLKIEQARSSEGVARALGNERAAVWANVEAKRQEAQLTKLKAAAAVAEAQSALQSAQAKFAEAEATGRVTAADRAALDAAQKSLELKLIEQRISGELAKQLDAEAAALIRTMNARKGAGGDLQDVASAGAQAADGMQQAAAGADQAGEAMGGAATYAAMLKQVVDELKGSIGEYSQSALRAVEAAEAQGTSFEDVAARLSEVRASVVQLVAEDPIGELRAQIDGFADAAARANAQARELERFRGFQLQGDAGFDKYVAELTKIEAALANAKARMLELDLAVARFNERVDAGNVPLARQESQLRALVTQAERLGSQQLNGLRAALEDVRRQMQDLADAARDTLGSIQDELDQIDGNYEAIERRRIASRRDDIEAQLAEAKAAGNSAAVAALTKALAALERLENARIAEARERAREERERAKADKGSKGGNAGGGGSGGGNSGGGGSGGGNTPPAASTPNVTINLQPGVDLNNRAEAEAIARALIPAINNLNRRGF